MRPTCDVSDIEHDRHKRYRNPSIYNPSWFHVLNRLTPLTSSCQMSTNFHFHLKKAIKMRMMMTGWGGGWVRYVARRPRHSWTEFGGDRRRHASKSFTSHNTDQKRFHTILHWLTTLDLTESYNHLYWPEHPWLLKISVTFRRSKIAVCVLSAT